MPNNCDLDFKENCMTRIASSCVDYEGEMSECSDLTDECKRYSVHETIEDINRQLTTICQDLDMSGVDMGCVVFEGEELRLRDVLDKVIEKLCETKEGDCELIMNTPIDCANLDYGCLVDECGDAIVPRNLKELLQSLINQSCNGNPDVPVNEKEYFYEEVINDIRIVENAPSPGPTDWFFPVGYETLTYENTKSKNMTVEVHISYEEETPEGVRGDEASIRNEVSSAIIKTTGIVDNVEYFKEGGNDIKVKVDNQDSNNKLRLDPSGEEANIGFDPDILKQNTSYFKVVTLEPNEKISLKFKTTRTIEEGSSRLKKAQILVKEL